MILVQLYRVWENLAYTSLVTYLVTVWTSLENPLSLTILLKKHEKNITSLNLLPMISWVVLNRIANLAVKREGKSRMWKKYVVNPRIEKNGTHPHKKAEKKKKWMKKKRLRNKYKNYKNKKVIPGKLWKSE